MLTPAAQKAYINTLFEALSNPGKAHTPMRVEDVIRKSEVRGGRGEREEREERRVRVREKERDRRREVGINGGRKGKSE